MKSEGRATSSRHREETDQERVLKRPTLTKFNTFLENILAFLKT